MEEIIKIGQSEVWLEKDEEGHLMLCISDTDPDAQYILEQCVVILEEQAREYAETP